MAFGLLYSPQADHILDSLEADAALADLRDAVAWTLDDISEGTDAETTVLAVGGNEHGVAKVTPVRPTEALPITSWHIVWRTQTVDDLLVIYIGPQLDAPDLVGSAQP